MTISKFWGSTKCLIQMPMIEVHEINIDPYAYCSMHKHEHKWNMFYVINGVLDIDRNEGNIVSLFPGQKLTVPPGKYHRFRANREPLRALEIYYPALIDANDIVRTTPGGRPL